jgi:hypothetical protein
MANWAARQFGSVVDRFKPECPLEAWDDLLLRYAFLREKGAMCGGLVAKKLTGGGGIWELLGHADNHQPRLLFYFRDATREIVFVDAFMKKGKQDYPPAIKRAKQRRKQIELGEKPRNVITTFDPTHSH